MMAMNEREASAPASMQQPAPALIPRLRLFPVRLLTLVLLVPSSVFAQMPTRSLSGEHRSDTSFAATVARLSEPSGFFDTDNLISNESSYLHVIPRLKALGVGGGAYIGVGPDQNYSYIAAIRPAVAYLIDLRRDNLLQHLMYKALFERSRNRMEFLCRWLGRPIPADVGAWTGRSIDDLLAYVSNTRGDTAFALAEQRAILVSAARTGIPLSAADRATIARFHSTFVREGLSLRFASFGRPSRSYYPTLRQLILERDAAGRAAGYLVREDDWRFVKSLHAADRILPAVGNLGGTSAFPAVARDIAARQQVVSALYTSNVEFYLWGDASFDRFTRSVASLPRNDRSVIIRSFFGRQFGATHPLAVSGYVSTQLLQTVDDFVARSRSGAWRTYWDVVTLGAQ